MAKHTKPQPYKAKHFTLARRGAVSEKDQKILWGRSAARCSMCAKELTFDDLDGNSQTFGAMCHIVSSSKRGPRGKSALGRAERDSYSNLILLCSNDHEKIDKDHKRWSVEKLHKVKDDHETSIGESIGSGKIDPQSVAMENIISSINIHMDLVNWNYHCDGFVRDILMKDWMEGRDALNYLRLGALWPSRYRALSALAQSVIDGFSDLILHFEENATVDRQGNYRADRSYRGSVSSSFHHAYHEYENAWSNVNYIYLSRLCSRLNKYSDLVRSKFDKKYRILSGKFIIVDSHGVRNDLRASYTLPASDENSYASFLKRHLRKEARLRAALNH